MGEGIYLELLIYFHKLTNNNIRLLYLYHYNILIIYLTSLD